MDEQVWEGKQADTCRMYALRDPSWPLCSNQPVLSLGLDFHFELCH